MVCYELPNGKLLVASEGVNGSALIVADVAPELRTAPTGSNLLQIGKKKVAVSLLAPSQQRTYTAGKKPVEITDEKKKEIEQVISLIKKRK